MGVKRTDGNLMFLYAFYLAALSVGNVMDRSMMSILGWSVPASVLPYPITLMILCTICELWTTDEAYKLVMLGISAKFLGIIMLTLSGVVTTTPIIGVLAEAGSTSYGLFRSALRSVGGRWVLGTSLRSWAGSMLSFAVAQALTVFMFNLVYENHVRKNGSPWGRRWWRFIVACMAGQFTDLGLFTVFCFYPNFDQIGGDMVAHIYWRIVLTLVYLLPYYVITWRTRRR